MAKVGRHTKIDENCVKELEEALKNGFTVSKACELSRISREAYYNRLETDSQFLDKMTKAQEFAAEVARQNIVTAIVKDKDVPTSRWYLERKAKKEFSTRSEVVGASGEPPYKIVVEVVRATDKKTDIS